MGRELRDAAEEAISAAWDDDDPLNYRERAVLLGLANRLKDDPGEIWTSDARMAAMLHMTARGYYEARQELMRRGLMVRIAGAGQGSRANRYRLLPDLSSTETGEVSSTDSREVTDQGSDPSSTSTQPSSTSTRETSTVSVEVLPQGTGIYPSSEPSQALTSPAPNGGELHAAKNSVESPRRIPDTHRLKSMDEEPIEITDEKKRDEIERLARWAVGDG